MASNRSLGQLTIDLVARVGGFTQGMTKAERDSKKWRKEVQKDLQAVGKSLQLAGAAAAGAFSLMVVDTVNSAKEIKNLKTVANTSADSLQRVAYAAGRYNVPLDKTADILKDVSDKVGDFLQTGGGPLADFFENIAPQVGVTADQFRDLSSDQALGLYVKSLQDANLSQSEMTFFMEAIASDATMLLPLFRDNAKELKALSKEADDFGAIISDVDIDRLADVKKSVDQMSGAFRGLKNEAVLGALPAIEDVVNVLTDPQTIQASKALANGIATSFSAATKFITGTVNVIQFLAQEVAAIRIGISADDIVRLEKDADRIRNLLSSDSLLAMGERIRFFGPDGIIEYLDDDELRAKLAEITGAIDAYYDNLSNRPKIPIEPELGGNEGGSGGGNGGGGDPDPDRAERLKSIEREISALEQQAAMLGMTETAAKLFKLETMGATDAQLASAAATLQQVDAFNKLETTNAEALNIAESLKDQETLIQESYDRRRQIILDNTVITGDARRKLLIDLENKKNSDLQAINADFWDSYLMAAQDNLQSLDQLAANTLTNIGDRIGDLVETAVFDFENLGDAAYGVFNGILRTTINSLGQMAAQWLALKVIQSTIGKQGSAAAVTEAATAGPAIAAAYAPAAAAVSLATFGSNMGPALVAIGAANAATQTAALAGMAHDGIDSVPQTGTWLLEKGERVTTAATSAKLDRTLEDVSKSTRKKQREDRAEMRESKSPGIRIVNAFDAEYVHEYLGSNAGEKVVLNTIRRNSAVIKQIARE